MFWSLLLAFVAVASANVIHDGNCPEMKAVENFDINAYQGVWFEISKVPVENEKKGKCASSEFKLEGDHFKVKNMHVIDGVQNVVEGTAKVDPNANKAGKLIVSLSFGDKAKVDAPLSVLATDYKNYAIAYRCKYDEKKKSHESQAWILSRTKKLEGEAKTAVDNFLKSNSKELDATKFVQTDFSEEACKFTKTVAVTEPPKQ